MSDLLGTASARDQLLELSATDHSGSLVQRPNVARF